jgi:outer membrane protein
MKHFLRYMFPIFLIVVFGNVHAQVARTEKKWSIQDCFQYAAEHNIQINTLRLNEQSTQQDLSAAKGLKIPSLSASVGNTFNNANNNAILVLAAMCKKGQS